MEFLRSFAPIARNYFFDTSVFKFALRDLSDYYKVENEIV
jgi:hypothetical protein